MKKFIAGLIVGLMLSSTAVFASNSISATFGSFNFLVNGQAKTVATQPIVYNNTSYLPVREISTMLGYDVDYQADTKTIKLSNTPKPSSVDSTTNIANTNSDASNLISANDLYKIYKVELSNLNGKDPVTLKYNGKKITTTDFKVINSIVYFDKSILGELGIN